MNAAEAWGSLSAPWQAAFEEAWESWRAGCFGIGAVLVEPSTLRIVASGRNRVAEQIALPRTLSGNMTAHAEMNAFAALERFNATGLHLYTTLEPCIMCASAAMLLRVEHVHFATHDEFYEGVSDLWAQHPLTSARRPIATGPLDGEHQRLARFARLLPMMFTLQHFPGRTAATLARQPHPQLAAIADNPNHAETLTSTRTDGSIVDALSTVWDQLIDRPPT